MTVAGRVVAHARAAATLQEQLSQVGLTSSQAAVLAVLGGLRDGESVACGRVSACLGLAPSAASELLDRLVGLGLVSRAPGGSGDQESLLALTDSGWVRWVEVEQALGD